MKLKLTSILALSLLFVASCGSESSEGEISNTDSLATAEEPTGENNVAYIWGAAALEGTARDTDRFRPRPTVTSRYLGLTFTAIFDAWSRYDETAIPVYGTSVERRPKEEWTLENKEKAISYAAYGALTEYYYSDSVYFQGIMKDLGYDHAVKSTDATTPEGVGNLVAQAVIDARKDDGSNQYASHEGSNDQPFFDYTKYNPVNSADKSKDVMRWQPKYFDDGKGGKFAPSCLTAHWGNVETIALDSASEFRPAAPPALGSEQLKNEVAEVAEIQEKMTDHDKALVEFMRDGPKSVQQAGHWLKFAQFVSRRDKHTLDQDVKMYFLVEITAMDGFIAAWETKMYYDYARPYALVHQYYKGKKIKAWGGQGKGIVEMDGSQWQPYSPPSFLCPPFPSYVSGHSAISGGCAEALKLFTGSDVFGDSAVSVAGTMTEIDPEFFGDTVVLRFPTFTQAAEMAGQSRVMGGYHIQADNVAGLELGRQVARKAWAFYNEHLGK